MPIAMITIIMTPEKLIDPNNTCKLYLASTNGLQGTYGWIPEELSGQTRKLLLAAIRYYAPLHRHSGPDDWSACYLV